MKGRERDGERETRIPFRGPRRMEGSRANLVVEENFLLLFFQGVNEWLQGEHDHGLRTSN